MSAAEVVRSLYGHRDGWWAIVERPLGLVTPLAIACHLPLHGSVELIYQGSADDDCGAAVLTEHQQRLNHTRGATAATETGQPVERATAAITFRVTPEERATLAMVAARTGQTLSAFLRESTLAAARAILELETDQENLALAEIKAKIEQRLAGGAGDRGVEGTHDR